MTPARDPNQPSFWEISEVGAAGLGWTEKVKNKSLKNTAKMKKGTVLRETGEGRCQKTLFFTANS